MGDAEPVEISEKVVGGGGHDGPSLCRPPRAMQISAPIGAIRPYWQFQAVARLRFYLRSSDAF